MREWQDGRSSLNDIGTYAHEMGMRIIGNLQKQGGQNYQIVQKRKGEKNMIDFAEKARISQQADETLKNILSKNYDTFDQYAEVSKITEIEVAKLIIKRLLDEVN